MSVECILKNVTQTVAEGPHWEGSTQSLLYVDIQKGDIHRWNSISGEDEKLHFDNDVSLIVPCEKNGYIISLGRTLAHIDWETKEVKSLHEVENGTRNRFNDGKCDSKGRLWAGTMGYEDDTGHVESETSSLYSLDTNGQLKCHVDKITISNGLAWTEDNRIMYFIDSTPKKVYAFDFDNDSGQISNQRVVIDFAQNEELGCPDGMTIDTDGMLWIACYNGARVVRFDPNTGKELQTVHIPALRTTSCCFGGKNLDELYVTSAKQTADETEMSKYPLTGSVFRVTELGVRGYPANNYAGL